MTLPIVGRTFNTFDEFRAAFWLEMSQQDALAQQFSALDREAMACGKPPFAPTDLALPERLHFELHHTRAVAAGGGVYDLSNIEVLAPRAHDEAHGR